MFSARIDAFVAYYENVGPFRRQRLIQDAIAGHGKMITSADWRLDMSLASSGASEINIPVVTLSFGYREGVGDRARDDTFQLQLPLGEVARLREEAALLQRERHRFDLERLHGQVAAIDVET